MANLPSIDISAMLVDDGVGVEATTLFINKEPGEQNLKDGTAIAMIYDSGGFDPDAAGVVFDKPTVNVRVKGKPGDHAGAATMIQAIKSSLHQRTPETKNSTRYMGIWQVGEIAFVEYDERNHPIFTANFRTHRTYST